MGSDEGDFVTSWLCTACAPKREDAVRYGREDDGSGVRLPQIFDLPAESGRLLERDDVGRVVFLQTRRRSVRGIVRRWWTEQMDRAFEKLRAQRRVLISADAKAGLLQAAASAYFEKADKGERGD
jgi:hypothetical protein